MTIWLPISLSISSFLCMGFGLHKPNLMKLILRPATAEDDPFMLALYTTSRDYEMALVPWDDAQKEAFLTMQYGAQRQGYQMQYPQAEWQIVEWEGEAIGRLIVDKRPDEMGLMDITIAPAWRGQGAGTHLIQHVQARAQEAGLPVRLYVDALNTAATRLYTQLGFTIRHSTEVDHHMEWLPPKQPILHNKS
jgi:ribosomal protein S18 acetylase RimI-like enzyme